MKIECWSVGKDHEASVNSGIQDYTGRISRYFPVEWHILSPPKNSHLLSAGDLKRKEAETICKALKKEDVMIALDEKGRQFTSIELASILQSKANESTKNLIFLIGGAYGLDETVLQKASIVWSLSKLTFPHQLVRLILAEQLYRSCSILRNEKYHHG